MVPCIEYVSLVFMICISTLGWGLEIVEHLFLSKLLIVISANKAKKVYSGKASFGANQSWRNWIHRTSARCLQTKIYLQRSQLPILNNWKRAVLGSFHEHRIFIHLSLPSLNEVEKAPLPPQSLQIITARKTNTDHDSVLQCHAFTLMSIVDIRIYAISVLTVSS